MIRALLLLALAAPAPALAQQPGTATRQVRLDLSPAGEAVVKRFLGTPDPAMERQGGQLRALAQQGMAITSAPRLDLAKLRAVMRQQEAVQATLQRRGNDRMLEMLGLLSDADRIKFLRSFRNARPAAGMPGAR